MYVSETLVVELVHFDSLVLTVKRLFGCSLAKPAITAVWSIAILPPSESRVFAGEARRCRLRMNMDLDIA